MEGRRNPARPFMWAVIALGSGAIIFSAASLPLARLDDVRFLLLALLVCVGSHGAVRIPRVSGRRSLCSSARRSRWPSPSGEAAGPC